LPSCPVAGRRALGSHLPSSTSALTASSGRCRRMLSLRRMPSAAPGSRSWRFISAAAESRPGEAGEVVAEEYRAWLWSLFTDLAEAAGAKHAKQLGRQLFLLYDGAAVAARMDKDRGAAAKAVRSAVEALLDAEIPAKRKRIS